MSRLNLDRSSLLLKRPPKGLVDVGPLQSGVTGEHTGKFRYLVSLYWWLLLMNGDNYHVECDMTLVHEYTDYREIRRDSPVPCIETVY